MKSWIVLPAFLFLSACVSPMEDSQNAQLCQSLTGLDENSEDLNVCRQWLNSVLIAKDPENFGLFPMKKFSDFACNDFYKLTKNTASYNTCKNKYSSIENKMRSNAQRIEDEEKKAIVERRKSQCKSYGFKIGSDSFAKCIIQQENSEKIEEQTKQIIQIEQQKMQMQRNMFNQEMQLREKQIINQRPPSYNCTQTGTFINCTGF